MVGAYQKFQKSVFAKSFHTQNGNFWQKAIFDIFGMHPPFSRKIVIFDVLSLLGAPSTPKSGLQNAPTPDPGHPHAPNFHATPPTTIPHLPCNFGGDCGPSEREIREKRDFGRAPPPLAGGAPRVPKNTKIATSQSMSLQSS